MNEQQDSAKEQPQDADGVDGRHQPTAPAPPQNPYAQVPPVNVEQNQAEPNQPAVAGQSGLSSHPAPDSQTPAYVGTHAAPPTPGAGAPPAWQPQPAGPVAMTPAPQGPRSKTWIIVAIVSAFLVVVAGVTVVLVSNHRADVAAQERRELAAQKAKEEKEAEAKAEREAAEKAAAELAAAKTLYSDCTSQINPLLHALENADARLNVGISQSELSSLIGKVSIAYNRIVVDDLGEGTCLNAAAQLEKAFNAYRNSVQQWNECIYDYGCDVDTIDPDLQAKWLRASTAIDKAESLIDTLDPDSADYAPDTSANNT